MDVKHGLNVDSTKYVGYCTDKEYPNGLNSMIRIDLRAFNEKTQINIFVPEKYETDSEEYMSVLNEIQNRRLSMLKIWDDDYDCIFCTFNDKDITHNLTIWLTDKEDPYLEIEKV